MRVVYRAHDQLVIDERHAGVGQIDRVPAFRDDGRYGFDFRPYWVDGHHLAVRRVERREKIQAPSVRPDVDVCRCEPLGNRRHGPRCGGEVDQVDVLQTLVADLALPGGHNQPAAIVGQVRLVLPIRVTGNLKEFPIRRDQGAECVVEHRVASVLNAQFGARRRGRKGAVVEPQVVVREDRCVILCKADHVRQVPPGRELAHMPIGPVGSRHRHAVSEQPAVMACNVAHDRKATIL